MSKRRCILAIMFIALGFCWYAYPWVHPEPGLVRISLTSTSDAYVFQGDPGRNYGSDASLMVSPVKDMTVRAFVKFDLKEIPPGSKLMSASLKLYVVSTTSAQRTYECSVADRDWAENVVNWNNQPSVVSGTSVPSIVPQAGKWMSWDVKGSVSQFLVGVKNFGWSIKDSIEGISPTLAAAPPTTSFASRENRQNKPTLEISFYSPKLSLSGPASANTGSWVKLTVERRDYDNNPITKGDLKVQLSTSSPSGRFSLRERGSEVREITIPNGKSSSDFYYVDDTAGTATIRADTNQYRDEYYEAGVLQLRVEPTETEGPSVTITATPQRAKETEVISISIEVSDPSGVDKVRVYQSGTRLGGPPLERTQITEFSCGMQTSPPILTTSSGPFPGMHTLFFEAEATDRYGNVGKGMTTVTILAPPPKRSCGCRESDKVTVPGADAFTPWDSIATGDVLGDGRDEVIVAEDDGGGRLFVYTWNLETGSFEAVRFAGDQIFSKVRYTHYDRLAVGDVIGDEKDEILIAVDEDGEGGTIYIYQIGPPPGYELTLLQQIDLNTLGIKFTHFDALLVGDLWVDYETSGAAIEKDEIIIARDDDEKLFVIDTGRISEGTDGIIGHYEFAAPSEGGFDEFRITAKTDNEDDDDNGHDEIAVANFLGDEYEEIMYADNNRDRLYIFGFKSYMEGTQLKYRIEIVRQFHIEFTKYDGMCVGDVLGDSKPEILMFRDEDRVALIYDPFLGVIKMQYIFYSPHDGVAAGDVVGSGKDLIFVGADDDNSIRISYSEEFWEG